MVINCCCPTPSILLSSLTPFLIVDVQLTHPTWLPSKPPHPTIAANHPITDYPDLTTGYPDLTTPPLHPPTPTPTHLHVSSHSQQQPQVHTHGPDVRARLTADPEDGQVVLLIVLNQLALVDGAHTQLALHSRDEGGTLEQGACQRLKGATNTLLATLHGTVEPECHTRGVCVCGGGGAHTQTDKQDKGGLGLRVCG